MGAIAVRVPVEITLHNQTQFTDIDEDDLLKDRMNVFVLSENPLECARAMCDRHVTAVCRDYAKILCLARHLTDVGFNSPDWIGVRRKRDQLPRNHHPCVRWAADSLVNYLWLLEVTRGTWAEYKYRHHKPHACEELDTLLHVGPAGVNGLSTHSTVATPPPQCVPEIYRVPQTEHNFKRWTNAVVAYREYYIHEVYRIAVWTNRAAPDWFIKGVRDFEAELASAELFKAMRWQYDTD